MLNKYPKLFFYIICTLCMGLFIKLCVMNHNHTIEIEAKQALFDDASKFTKDIIIENEKLKANLELLKQIEFNTLIEPSILKAVIMIESSNNPKAHKEDEGAVGLMQLRPIVYNKICGLTKEEAFEPKKNVACGSLYLKSLLHRFGGNLEKALHFYNSGSIGNPKYITKIKKRLDCKKGEKICRKLLKSN